MQTPIIGNPDDAERAAPVIAARAELAAELTPGPPGAVLAAVLVAAGIRPPTLTDWPAATAWSS